MTFFENEMRSMFLIKPSMHYFTDVLCINNETFQGKHLNVHKKFLFVEKRFIQYICEN